jgi:hypothetical protein
VASVLAGGGHQYVPFAGQSVGLIRQVLPAGYHAEQRGVRRAVAGALDGFGVHKTV